MSDTVTLPTIEEREVVSEPDGWWQELNELDIASYAAPEAGIPLGAAAALVAYSRVHTGVHYPVDVIAGSVTGTTLAQLVVAVLDRERKQRTAVPLRAGRRL